MLCCVLDLTCFVVRLVSRTKVTQALFIAAVKRIFRYLQETRDFVIYYQGGDLKFREYCDADWASDRDERKSTT